MLNKDWITDIELYSEEWERIRLGKFTSSKIHNLMSKKPLTEGSLSYINQKVGELITGQTIAGEDELVENESTAWGLINEPFALQEFGKAMNVKYLVVGKLVHEPGSRFSSTPDALWVLNSSITKENHYNVATVEAKSPHKYHTFIPIYRCKTPAALKIENRNYYWQVLDQMHNCCAAVGYFLAYHPLFPVGNNLRIIEFKKIDLWEDFSFLEQRKKQALQLFSEIYSEFFNQKT